MNPLDETKIQAVYEAGFVALEQKTENHVETKKELLAPDLRDIKIERLEDDIRCKGQTIENLHLSITNKSDEIRQQEVVVLATSDAHVNALLEIESLRAKLAMQAEALNYALDDLRIRAKLAEDDSLNIGQGCLDQMHKALNATSEEVAKWEATRKAEIEKGVLTELMVRLSMNVECGEFESSVEPTILAFIQERGVRS